MTPFSFNNVDDYRMSSEAPDNTYLCGVKVASFKWESNGVSKLWMRYCNKYNWNTKTDKLVFEDQTTKKIGSFGGEGC